MTKKKLFLLTLVLSLGGFSAAHALPSPLTWEYAGWGGGGAFPTIVPHPTVSGRVFAVSDVAGIWRSDDRGNQWTFSTPGLKSITVMSLAIAPSNANVMYIATQVGVHRSDDGGATWTFLSDTSNKVLFKRPDNYRAIAVNHTNAGVAYAATSTGEVYQTLDTGLTWTRLGSTTYPFGSSSVLISALFLSNDDRFLYAGSSAGLLRYNFATGLWESTGLPAAKVYDIASIMNQQVETIYVTYGKKIAWQAGGAAWQYSNDIPITNGESYRLAARLGSGGNVKFLVAWRYGWSGGAFLSEDGGISWVNVERNLSHDMSGSPTRAWKKGMEWPLSVAFDPADPNIFYFSDFWSFWRSEDNGFSWSERIRGAGNTVGSDIAVSPSNTIYVGTMDNGLTRSTDGGVTYQALVPWSSTDYSAHGHVWRILLLSGGSKIVATNSPWDTGPNQILISTDGGATFTRTRNGLPTSYPVTNVMWDKGYARALAYDPTNPSKLYLGIDGDEAGFYYSNDGGYNWIKPTGQPGSKRIYNGLAVDPVETKRLYWGATGTSGGVYRSEDFGVSWTRVFSTCTWVFDIATSPEGYVYAAGDAGGPSLYVSTNKGVSWTLIKNFGGSGTCEAIAIDPADSKRIAVSTVKWGSWTPGRVFITEDRGVTWTDITANLPNGSGAAAMAFGANGTLYLSRYAGTVYKMNLNAAADTTAPSVPGNLTSSISGNSATLNWDASTDNVGVTGYKVYRNNAEIATTTALGYSDNSLTAGNTYSYNVKAFDAAGNHSAASNTVTLSLNDTTPPTAPTNLAYSLTNGTVNLTWTASTDNVAVTGYRVYRNSMEIGQTTSPSYSDATAVWGSSYTYTVKAFDASGNLSAVSNSLSVSLNDTTPPTAPANLIATVVSGPAVSLTWSTSSDNVGVALYRVYRGSTEIGSTASTAYQDSTVASGVTYVYTVKAFDAAGNASAASNSAVITVPDTIPPTAPTNLSAVPQGGQAVLSWAASTDNFAVAQYQIFRNNSQIGTSASTSYTDGSVSGGSSYTYNARAVDSAGNVSTLSNSAQVTMPEGLAVLSESSTVSGVQATIVWQTNIPSTGYVKYGDDNRNNLYMFSYDVPLGTNQTVVLNDLREKRTYFYQVVAQNGQETVVTPVDNFHTDRAK